MKSNILAKMLLFVFVAPFAGGFLSGSFAPVRAAAPPTMVLSTINNGTAFATAAAYNSAVDAIYADGCRFSFQMQAPPGVDFQPMWTAFSCGQSAGETAVISSDDYTEPSELNSAFANLVDKGYTFAFSVPAPAGDHIATWAEFWRVK